MAFLDFITNHFRPGYPVMKRQWRYNQKIQEDEGQQKYQQQLSADAGEKAFESISLGLDGQGKDIFAEAFAV